MMKSEDLVAQLAEKETGKLRTVDTRSTVKPWFQQFTPEEMSKIQDRDPDIQIIKQAQIKGERPTAGDMARESAAARFYWTLLEQLYLEDGVLCKRFKKENGTGQYTQIIVAVELKQELMRLAHDNVISGHLGIKETLQKILHQFFWFNLKEDLKLYIKACDTCACDKKLQKKANAPMGHLPSGAPWDTLAIDFLGPLPVTERGNRYIMVATDHFTKYVEVIAVPTLSANDCA